MRTVAAAVLALAILIGCGGSQPPTPTPGTLNDVIANLVLRGANVHNLVSGDPGCPTSALHDNALSLEVALGNQSALHQIYLFRWRRASDFDAAAQAFADCVAEYEALHPGVEVGQLESSPWRAYGTLWTDELETIVRDAVLATEGG